MEAQNGILGPFLGSMQHVLYYFNKVILRRAQGAVNFIAEFTMFCGMSSCISYLLYFYFYDIIKLFFLHINRWLAPSVLPTAIEKPVGCPDCREPITSIKRYGRIIKKRALDIADIKFEVIL